MKHEELEQTETLWSPREAGEFLNVSPATLSRWRRRKVGPPFFQIGDVARYSPPSVRAWVRDQERRDG